MKARILTIGDELLIGQVIDTNAAWLGETLTALGIHVVRADTVGDDADRLRAAIGECLRTADLVIATGGLGPTHDDITKTCVQELFGVGTRFDADILEHVRARFERRGIPMPGQNRSQAEIPEGFEALPNPVGTAPGLWRPADGTYGILVVMPGVPHEMKTIMQTAVIPRLAAVDGRRSITQHTLLTTGVGESTLQEKLEGVADLLSPDLSLAYLPSLQGVRLRITGTGRSAGEAEGRALGLVEFIRGRIGRHIFGEGDDTLESVVGRLLERSGSTVAIAESCTGGLVAHRLTNVSGASQWVLGGVVAYANETKTGVLGVCESTIEAYGAVSREVALEMAIGVRERLGAVYGVATTGIMGPGGGTPEKPVGTVWIAVAGPSQDAHAILLRLGTDRQRNKERASTGALDMLRRRLEAGTGEGPGPVGPGTW